MGESFTKKTSFADLWSEIQPLVTVDNSGTDQSLPAITIANRPKGVQRAIMIFKYRAIEDNSGAENKLVGDQVMQASLDGFTTPVDAISLPDSAIDVAASAKEGGDVIMGDLDIKDALPANGDPMDFKWALAKCTAASLLFHDVQVGVRFYYI